MEPTEFEKKWIAANARYHDRVSSKYRHVHREIYNPIEQARLAEAIAKAVAQVRGVAGPVLALDVGTGAGNLTGHLLQAGCRVVAADISQGFLDEVGHTFPEAGERLETALLNGMDLSNWPDGYFDFCGTYSVLHHVPDYLRMVEEMARVTRPGGVVFIDHESSEEAWAPPPAGVEYLERFRATRRRTFRERWGPAALGKRIVIKARKLRDPRYQEEGDIHIWEDDHIEWDRIEERLSRRGATDIHRESYLVCREADPRAPLYHEYRARYADMSLLVAVMGLFEEAERNG